MANCFYREAHFKILWIFTTLMSIGGEKFHVSEGKPASCLKHVFLNSQGSTNNFQKVRGELEESNEKYNSPQNY